MGAFAEDSDCVLTFDRELLSLFRSISTFTIIESVFYSTCTAAHIFISMLHPYLRARICRTGSLRLCHGQQSWWMVDRPYDGYFLSFSTVARWFLGDPLFYPSFLKYFYFHWLFRVSHQAYFLSLWVLFLFVQFSFLLTWGVFSSLLSNFLNYHDYALVFLLLRSSLIAPLEFLSVIHEVGFNDQFGQCECLESNVISSVILFFFVVEPKILTSCIPS